MVTIRKERVVAARDELTAAQWRDVLLNRLRIFGMRRTEARAAVLDALLVTPHQSVNDLPARVAARGIPVDLSSVHRIVEAFVSVGLVHALPTVDGSTYGLADRPHHHAICTSCGRIQEIPAPQLSAALADLAQASGLRVAPDDPAGGLILYGTCDGCQKAEADRPGASGQSSRK